MATKQETRRPTKRQREKSGLVFEAPGPKVRRKPGKWHVLLAEIQQFPGEWVRVETKSNTQQANSLATNLRFITKRIGGQWKVSTRTNADHTCAVYVQYVGA